MKAPIIPLTPARWQSGDWRAALRTAITDPHELLTLLGLKTTDLDLSQQACLDFPLRVPREFVARMTPGNPHDPLLLQVLPTGAELNTLPGYSDDPLAEAASNPVPGLIHKYAGRALLIAAVSCAVHCRYCFRRHFPYNEHRPAKEHWQPALDYIRARPDIHEIILSGGDPLTLPDDVLAWLVSELATIPHLLRLRIHTRVPVVIPQRITPELVAVFSQSRLQPVVVLHCNHAQEIDDSLANAVQQLRRQGITVLNQSVLLRRVNDNIDALAALSEALFAAGIVPYYLHLLDRVQGAAHFDVPEPEAVALHQALQARLSGYLVPKLVREVPGAPAKQAIP